MAAVITDEDLASVHAALLSLVPGAEAAIVERLPPRLYTTAISMSRRVMESRTDRGPMASYTATIQALAAYRPDVGGVFVIRIGEKYAALMNRATLDVPRAHVAVGHGGELRNYMGTDLIFKGDYCFLQSPQEIPERVPTIVKVTMPFNPQDPDAERWWILECNIMRDGLLGNLSSAVQRRVAGRSRVLTARTRDGVEYILNSEIVARDIFAHNREILRAAGIGQRAVRMFVPRPACQHRPYRVEFLRNGEMVEAFKCHECQQFLAQGAWF